MVEGMRTPAGRRISKSASPEAAMAEAVELSASIRSYEGGVAVAKDTLAVRLLEASGGHTHDEIVSLSGWSSGFVIKSIRHAKQAQTT